MDPTLSEQTKKRDLQWSINYYNFKYHMFTHESSNTKANSLCYNNISFKQLKTIEHCFAVLDLAVDN